MICVNKSLQVRIYVGNSYKNVYMCIHIFLASSPHNTDFSSSSKFVRHSTPKHGRCSANVPYNMFCAHFLFYLSRFLPVWLSFIDVHRIHSMSLAMACVYTPDSRRPKGFIGINRKTKTGGNQHTYHLICCLRFFFLDVPVAMTK